MSIWSAPSKYGTYPMNTKHVSESTMRRWVKENRSKTRRAKALIKKVV